MNPLKRIRRFAAVLAGLSGALVAFGATPAFAMHVPPPGSGVMTSPVGTTRRRSRSTPSSSAARPAGRSP